MSLLTKAIRILTTPSDWSEPTQFMSLKKMAHKFEIADTTKLEGIDIRLEGANPQFFAQEMIDSFGSFNKEFPTALSNSESIQLDSLLRRSIEASDDAQRVWEDVQNELPVMIFSGFSGHAINFCIYGDYLLISNKGGISRKPLEVLKSIHIS